MDFLEKLKIYNRKRVERRRIDRANKAALGCGADMVISTPPHCVYIAKCVEYALHEEGLRCYINTEKIIPKTKAEVLHMVICPQLYDVLPDGYIAYQMEQTLSSSWFDGAYIEKLNAASVILDYSESNVVELRGILRGGMPIFCAPIPLVRQSCPPIAKEFDVAFYGNVEGSERRRIFLNEVCQRYRTRLIHGKHGADLYDVLRSANLVVNIHYYENAPLETTRIMECLSLGVPVVSETARDIECYPGVHSVVTFSEEGQVDDMIAKIKEVLGNIQEADRAVSEEGCGELFYDDFKAGLRGALKVRRRQ